jgi:hypothetical protein
MGKWEYKSVLVNRTGNQEDFSYTWTYTPWQMLGVGATGQEPVHAGCRNWDVTAGNWWASSPRTCGWKGPDPATPPTEYVPSRTPCSSRGRWWP